MSMVRFKLDKKEMLLLPGDLQVVENHTLAFRTLTFRCLDNFFCGKKKKIKKKTKKKRKKKKKVLVSQVRLFFVVVNIIN
jgi:hypothetical protein